MPMCQLAALNNIPMHIIYQCPMNNLLIIQFILSIPQLAYWHIATLANYSVQWSMPDQSYQILCYFFHNYHCFTSVNVQR